MGAVLLLVRARLRANRRSTVVLAVLVGVAVAIVLAALAGARRTDRSFAEFVASDRGADAYAAFTPVELGGDASRDLVPEAERVAATPGVAEVRRFTNAVVSATDPSAPKGRRTLLAWIPMEPGALVGLTRPHLVEGRLPDDRAADEIAVDEQLARDAGLAVGDPYPVQVFTAEQLSASTESPDPAEGAAADAVVVGIVRRPTDLRDLESSTEVDSLYLTQHNLYLTAALWDETGGDVAVYNPAVAITVDRHAEVAALMDRITADFDGTAFAENHAEFIDNEGTFKGVQRSISLQSRALQVFAAVAALAGLFLAGQTIGRQLYLEAAESATLRALSMTRGQLRASALLRAGPVAIGGTFLGLLGALALSPLTPLPGSVARRAEVAPGVEVDLPVMALGLLAAPVLLALAALLPTLRSGSGGERTPGRARPTLASRLGASVGSAAAVVGVRFALEPGRGSAAVPVRTAIAMAAVSIAVVLGSVVFAASLDGTRGHPERYGVTWDVSAGSMVDPDEAAERAADLAGLEGIEAFSGAVTTDIAVDGQDTIFLFLRDDGGRVAPLLVEGRLPGEGEVAFGRSTVDRLDTGIGESVEIDAGLGDGPKPFAVVGTFVMNTAGLDVSASPDEGALIDWSAVERLAPEQSDGFAPQSFLIRFRPGADRREATAAVRELFPSSTTPPVEPADLANLADVRLLPLVLAALVAVLGVGTVGHALLSAVRRRRRELAVLKSIGFAGRDAMATIAWQALTFASLALLMGVPAGVALGRVSWSVAANQVGIVDRPEVPLVGVAAGAGLVVALLVAIAVVPATLARRVPAAAVLRRD